MSDSGSELNVDGPEEDNQGEDGQQLIGALMGSILQNGENSNTDEGSNAEEGGTAQEETGNEESGNTQEATPRRTGIRCKFLFMFH